MKFHGVTEDVDAVFNTLPKPDPSNPQAMSKAMQDIQPQLMAPTTQIKPLVTILAEVGKRYGIEDLQKLGPRGQEPPRKVP